ncbi:MAG: hypothetical protein Q8P57_04525 [Candidatus Pacearchaeota archaeon]|nr:hypothetical protein [Candidatus Pacearchaeota archaeon]
MTNKQRMKSDIATDERREATDKALSKNRDKNDALTQERRFEADATLRKNRAINDGITADRREIKDEKGSTVIVMSMLIGLAAGVTIMLI